MRLDRNGGAHRLDAAPGREIDEGLLHRRDQIGHAQMRPYLIFVEIKGHGEPPCCERLSANAPGSKQREV